MTSLDAFLSAPGPVARVRLARVRGSSPREAGCEMYVSETSRHGTIGGGQLEHRAIAAARALLARGDLAQTLDVPLGPEIGQCCGGRVEVTLSRMSATDRHAARARAAEEAAALPMVQVHGAGHVGRALADLLQLLPVRCVLIDSRAEELALSAARVETRLTPLPEIEIAMAPPGSAFIVLTHDHALDFLCASAALQRDDARYVGLIGSATKREKFRRFARDECDGLETHALTCPIGAQGSRDKRPEVIAAFVVAEVLTALTSQHGAAQPMAFAAE
ncbi:xanthine dehydrogenase accessory protein XdhC [Alloyangia pacifica]|uniref:xanthine dehydrogenase accessory protein XdhC n=1 Tax=Alloyangia pacifica TaxID=311180 RepID=UPI001CFCEC78|nr:xanthine dehydrogenase accessory protein XdhC [Alloyangia pacifica]